MISRKLINRLIILLFFVLVGYGLATSIASRSVVGTILALVSLGAGIRFLYLLALQQQQQESEEAYQEN